MFSLLNFGEFWFDVHILAMNVHIHGFPILNYCSNSLFALLI